MSCIYMLECEDGTYYTGYAENVEKRFEKHVKGKGAKYTKAHKPKCIVLQCKCKDKSDALKIEHKIKKLSHTQKKMLIFEFHETLLCDEDSLYVLLKDLK